MKKLLLFMLALCMLLPLAACAGTGTDETAAETEETTEAYVPGPALVENGEPAYKLIRSSKASDALVTATTALNKQMRTLTGKTGSYSEDFITEKTADNDDKEILVGSTNRPKSAEKLEELSSGDWFVGVSGNKILIIGGTDSATIEALAYFTENLAAAYEGKTDTDSVTLDFLLTDKVYKKEYSGMKIKIAGTALSDYTVHYAASNKSLAETLISSVNDACGASLSSVLGNASAKNGKELVVGVCPNMAKSSDFAASLPEGTVPYSVNCVEGVLYFSGKDLWGLTAAVNVLLEHITSGTDIEEGFSESGDAYGKTIFGLTSGADIRIISNNVWNCNNNLDTWIAFGGDCSAASRAPGLAAVYIALKPDVINFQEMTPVMLSLIRTELKNAGLNYKVLTTEPSRTDYTPILYNADTVKVINNDHHIFTYGCDSQSKGYHWALFEHIATGTRFIDLSTHLWWKSESAQAGSDEWRSKQAAEIVALSDKLIAEYNVPMVIMGDLNMRTSAAAYGVLTKGNFEDCHDIALAKDNTHGHHKCGKEGYSTELYSGDYSTAIDHALIKNRGNWQILSFRQPVTDFYWRLTDHIPVVIDIKFAS